MNNATIKMITSSSSTKIRITIQQVQEKSISPKAKGIISRVSRMESSSLCTGRNSNMRVESSLSKKIERNQEQPSYFDSWRAYSCPGVDSSTDAAPIHTKDSSSAVQSQRQRHQNSKPRPTMKGEVMGNRNNNYSQKPKNITNKTVQILDSNFLSGMHSNCLAGKYKVHRLGCNCTTAKRVFPNATSSSTSSGLLVVPHTKMINIVFVLKSDTPITEDCAVETNEIINTKTTIRTLEHKLREEIFPSSNNTTKNPFNVSCASCLLEMEPNGFVCISSKKKNEIESAIHIANQQKARKKRKQELHSDHAFLLCAIPRKLLWKLFIAKTRSQTTEAMVTLCSQLINDGILHEEETPASIKLGSHLEAMLRMTAATRREQPPIDEKEDLRQMENNKMTATDEGECWWLVMVECNPLTKKRNNTWHLDLPGGKRHLGESTFQCAIRETEEETSLVVDETWLTGPPFMEDVCNLYYPMCPPDPIILLGLSRLSL